MVSIKSILLIFGLCAAFASWYLFVRAPLASQRMALQADIAQAEADLAQSEAIVAQIPQFLTTQRELEELRRQLEGSIFSRTDLLLLMGDINRRVTAAQLQLTELTPTVEELLAIYDSRPRTADEIETLSIAVRVSGSFVRFGEFVREIENAPYFRGMQSCVIAQSPSDDRQLNCLISFRALVGSGMEFASHE